MLHFFSLLGGGAALARPVRTLLAGLWLALLPLLVLGQAPAIIDFNPKTGPAGTAVTLTGTNLEVVTGVRFGTGSLTTNFVSQSATSLTVRVPVVSSTGVITLTTSSGSTASTATAFAYTPRQNLTAALSPAGQLDVCQPRTLTASASSIGFSTGSGFSCFVYTVVAQADGKVLVGGCSNNYNGSTVNGLVRLNADGTRDATFATSPGFTLNGSVSGIAVQADGKILAGGSFTTFNGVSANYFIRLNANGSTDPTFATGTGFNGAVESVAVQADGKVLVGGGFTSYNSTTANGIVRLNADGSPDATFVAGSGFSNGTVRTMVVQADGKVLVGGNFTSYNGTAANRLIRLNANGSPDTGFATGSDTGSVVSIAVQADGKVLVGGSFFTYNATTGTYTMLAIKRLNADGSPDATFVTGTGFNAGVQSMAVQANGQVVVGGDFTSYNGTTANGLARLNANGSLDPGFTTATGFYYAVRSVALQADGKVFSGSLTSYNGTPGNLLVRLNPDGSPNTAATAVSGATFSFSPGNTTSNPLVTSTAGSYTATASLNGETSAASNAVVLTPCVPVISSFGPASGPAGTSVTLTGSQLDLVTGVRFGTGTLTTNFVSQSATSLTVRVPVVSSTGIITLTNNVGGSASTATAFTYTPRQNLTATLSPAGPQNICQPRTLTATASNPAFATGTGFDGYVNSVMVQADGKVLVSGGFLNYQGASAKYFVRLNADGSRDPGFNTGAGFSGAVSSLAVQADGKVLAGGSFTTYQGATANRLIRLNADGSIDGSFATGAGFNSNVQSVAVQADGKVLAGGLFTSYNGTAANYFIRLNADGSPDAGFATGTGFNSNVQSVAVQADGKVLAVGNFSSYNGTAAGSIIRLNADGSPDAAFATGAGFSGSLTPLVYSVAVQADGKVLVGGAFSSYQGATASRLIRLNADGSPDAGFATGTGFNNFVQNVAVQADGKVLVGGAFSSYQGATASRLIRLNANGSPDAGFATGTGFINSVAGVAVQADGKVLVGGNFSSYNGTAAGFIIRLNADGSPNTAATAVSGATFSFSPGNTTSNPLVTSTAGSYTATASLNGETSAASNAVVLTPCVPVISSFGPASGPAGTSVTLTGSQLDLVTGVRFGTGTLTTNFVSQSATSLTVRVPVVSSTGPITLTAGNGNTASTATNFTYTPRPAGLTATLNPAGPLDACVPRTLTATASSPAFGVGAGFNNYVGSVVVQADGKVLVGGDFTSYDGTTVNRLVRLNADGSRDATFVTGTGFDGQVRSVAVQADGKVLVGGQFTTYQSTAANYLVRLNADGSRDASFATGAGFSSDMRSLAVQADGKVLVGGNFTTYQGTTVNRLVRLNADGSRDATFVTGTGFDGQVRSLAVQADGKVVVGGDFTTYQGTGANYLVRLNADGSPDAPFVTGAGFDAAVFVVAVQADGKVLAGGRFASYQSTAANRFIRLNANGSRDAGFASSTGFNGDVNSITLQADGKVLVGGGFSTYNGAFGYSQIIRLNADGTPDGGFATGPGFNSFVQSIAVQADGQVLVGGGFTTYQGTTANRFIRLNAGGSRNTTATPVLGASFSFSPGGSTTNPLVTSTAGSYTATASLNGETSAPSNAVVLTPCPPPPTLSSFAPASGPAGTPVTLTGTNLQVVNGVRFGTGTLTTNFVSQSATSLTVLVPVVASTGPITVTTSNGSTASTATNFTYVPRLNLVAALSPVGPLDVCAPRTLTASATIPAFAAGTGFNTAVFSLAVQADSKVLVGGTFTTYQGTTANYLVRLNADGSRDGGFATGIGFNSNVQSVAVQADGKIVVGGGFFTYQGTTQNRLVRLNADGTVDATFATGTGFNNQVNSVVVQADSKVLVGGLFTTYQGATANYLVRLNADGSLDAAFNAGGAGFNSDVRSLAVQADGKVLVGGAFLSYNGTTANRLARLNADGTLDAGFATGAGFNNSVLRVVVQADGKVLMSGQFTTYQGTTANYLVRLNADGSRDAAFNAGGAGFSNTVASVAVQADGKLLAGGLFTSYNGTTQNYLARLNADGSLDAGFATGTGFNSQLQTVAVQADGKVLAGGFFTTYQGTAANYFVRLNPDATPNTTATAVLGATFTFSPGGSTTNPLVTSTPGSYTATASFNGDTSAPSNTVVVTACPTFTDFNPKTGPAGTLVTLTGTNLEVVTGVRFGTGSLTTNFVSQSATSLTVLVPVVSSTGPVTLSSSGGTSVSSATAFTYVPRLNLAATLSPAGPLDGCAPRTLTATAVSPAFATATSFNNFVSSVAVQADGKVLVGGGFLSYQGTTANRLVRLNADGSPDAGFATGTGFNNNVTSLAVQADGKVLVGGGFLSYQGTTANRLVRLNADGTLDAGFATGTGFNSTVNSVVVQADGKLLVGGAFTTYQGTTANYLVRLNANGSLDAAFNAGAGFDGAVQSVAVQADGKLLVGGSFTTYQATTAGRLVRLSADGSLDASFATGVGFNSSVFSLAVQADGKVLVGGGFTTYQGTTQNYLARLSADGSLDAGFATGAGFNTHVLSVAVQADGRVLVGGQFTTYQGTTANYLARLNADGTRDVGFAIGAGFNPQVLSVAVQADGKVLVGGIFTTYQGTTASRLARLNADGSLNNTSTPVSGATFTFAPGSSTTNPLVTSTPGRYTATASLNGETSAPSNTVVLVVCSAITSFTPADGPAGTLVTLTGTGLDLVTGVRFGTGSLTTNFVSQSATSLTVRVPVVSSTGPITFTTGVGITGSSATNFTYTPRPGGLLATLSPAGPLDGCQPRTLTATAASPAFATGAGFSTSVTSVAVQADGKVLVGGNFTTYQGTTAGRLARLNPDGTPDAGFATGTGFDGQVNSVVVQADGKVLVGGIFLTYQGNPANYLTRLNADGSPDAGFATATSFNNAVTSVAVQADGKVLVGGSFTSYNGTTANRLARLNADGSLDTGFATGAGFNNQVLSVAVQADGKVLAGGGFTTYQGTTAVRLVRLNADGTLDTGFATATSFNSTVNSVAVQADGKVLVGGLFATYQGATASRLVRLNADGSRDAGFVVGTGFNSTVNSVAVQADGKVLVGGVFTTYQGTTQNRLVRLNANGSRDAGFAIGTGFNSAVNSVAVQADGKVLAGGVFTTYQGTTGQNYFVRLNAGGSLNNTATAVSEASFTFSPGGSTTNPLVTSTPGSYTATASLNGETSAASNAVELTPCQPALTALSTAAELPGQAVVLIGTNFTSGSTVSFGGVAAASVSYTSPTSLTAVVPVEATPGSSAVVVGNVGASTSSSPAFEVLQVYRDATPSGCLSTEPLTLTGSGGTGSWRYLRLPGAGGAVVAAIEDTQDLGTVTAGFAALGTATTDAVRVDGHANRRYLDRNFYLTATNQTFTGQTVQVRFFGLSSELSRLTAADANATLAGLKASQYSGANENCELADNDPDGERRLLPAPATVVDGTDWFTAQVAVADHFSEFYLTGASSPLPVELLTFTAQAEGRAVQLAWRTASEKNSARFEVERSVDGKAFKPIGEVAAQGSKGSPTAYIFLDDKLPIAPAPYLAYYRLRQVDLDGTASYSPVRAVALGGKQLLTLYPNPARSAVAVGGLSAGASIEVLDALGRAVAHASADAAGTARLALPAGLAAGVYIVRSGAQVQRLTVE